MIQERLAVFAGLPVHEFDGQPGPLPPPGEVAWGIYQHIQDNGVWGAEVSENFDLFLEKVDTTQVTHLVIGFWGHDLDEFDPVAELVDVADRFPALRAVFLGDILDWELHLSWIKHSDISPLFSAFSHLEHFGIRGSDGLELAPLHGTRLRTLRFEWAHLSEEVLRAVVRSELPALERLDLWLGQAPYEKEPPVPEITELLTGERLPALRHLRLENASFTDEIAEAVAGAPVVARLESLSLAMGTLTDRGAEALLSGRPLDHLDALDLHHHFLSEAMMARVRAALPGVLVNLDDGHHPPRRRRRGQDFFPGDCIPGTYIAVNE